MKTRFMVRWNRQGWWGGGDIVSKTSQAEYDNMKLIVGKWWFRAGANTMGEYGKGKGKRNRGKWNAGNMMWGTERKRK